MACVVLWDLAALPGVDDAAVGVTAKRFAKARYSLTADVKAFGDVSSLSPALRYSLHVAGVQLNDSVESGLISEMFCWAWDNRPPATIIILNVANATKQLRSALAKLVDRGYTVVVLEPPGATAEEAVWGAEHVAWAAVEAAVAGQDAPMMSSSESSVCSSVVHQRRSEDDALLTERRSSTLDYTERRSTLDWSKDYRSRDAWSDALAARNDWGTSSSSSSSEPPPPPQPRSFGSSPKRRASSPRHSSEWSRSDWSRSEAAAHSPKTNWAAQTRTDWASPQSLRRSSQSDCLGSSQSSRSDCLRLSQDSPQTLQPLPRGYFQGPPHALEALRRSGFHDICALLRHVHKHKRPTSHVVPNDAVPKSLLIAAARELSGFPRIVVECTRAARAGMIVTGGAHPNEWVRASSDRNDSTPVGTPPPPRGSPCDSAHASPGSECSLEFIRGSAASISTLRANYPSIFDTKTSAAARLENTCNTKNTQYQKRPLPHSPDTKTLVVGS